MKSWTYLLLTGKSNENLCSPLANRIVTAGTLVKSTIAEEHLNPLIFEATLITESTVTCIDHIFANFVFSSSGGGIAIERADHLPVFTITYDPNLSLFPDTVEVRDFKRFNNSIFRETSSMFERRTGTFHRV